MKDRHIKRAGEFDEYSETLLLALTKLPLKPPKGFTYSAVTTFIKRAKSPN